MNAGAKLNRHLPILILKFLHNLVGFAGILFDLWSTRVYYGNFEVSYLTVTLPFVQLIYNSNHLRYEIRQLVNDELKKVEMWFNCSFAAIQASSHVNFYC